MTGRAGGIPAPAVVLEMKPPQSLCISRSLGRRGIPVVGFDDDPRCLGFRSRYCHSVLLPSIEDQPGRWLEALLDYGTRLGTPAVLFPCSDATALFVARHRDALQPHFRTPLAPPGVTELLLDKLATCARAEALGVPVPRYRVLQAGASLEESAQAVGFPCALKPIQSHRWRRHIAGKLVPAHSLEELRARWEVLREHQAGFFLTELIPGDDTDLYALYTYLGADGEPRFSYTKRKLRQYPPHFGNGSLHEGVWEPEVAELGLKLLRGLGYRGFAHVEFKRDWRDGRFKLIEVNPRCAISLALLVASGIDAPHLAYRELLGEAVAPQVARTHRKKLLFLLQDCEAFREYRREGILTWGSWLKSLRGTNVFGIFAWDDPMPFLHSIGGSVGRSLLNRLRRLLPKPRRSSEADASAAVRAARPSEHNASADSR